MRKSTHMPPTEKDLTRRERQVMDILYQLTRASAQEVQEALPDRPHYSAVRSLLAILEEKGAVKHTRESRRYIYEPTVSPGRARKGALRRLLSTFFDDSPEQLVQNLLDPVDGPLSAAEVARIRLLLNQHEAARPSPDKTSAKP